MEFERAAELRIFPSLWAKTIKKNRRFQEMFEELVNDAEEALLKLEKQLGLNAKPKVIECFDISHVSELLWSPPWSDLLTENRTRKDIEGIR